MEKGGKPTRLVEVGGECQGRKASLDYLRKTNFDNVR